MAKEVKRRSILMINSKREKNLGWGEVKGIENEKEISDERNVGNGRDEN